MSPSSRGRGVLTLQRRFRELGRVRMGDQVASGKGKRPRALRTWRFTSYGDVGRRLLEQAADLYGSERGVIPWETAPDDNQAGWEVTTTTDSLDFLVPPTEQPFSVDLELWTAAGCARRCNGETALVYEGRGRGWRERSCLCQDPTDPNARDCSIVMRFGIILPRIEGLGVWGVQTHSFHGAEELQGALAILAVRASRGIATPATLRIEPRKIKRPATDPNTGEVKTEVSQFIVPVIDVPQSVAALLGSGDAPVEGRLAIEAHTRPTGRPALTAGAPDPIDEPGVPVVTGEVLEPEDPGGEAPPPPPEAAPPADPMPGERAPEPHAGPGAGRPASSDGVISRDDRVALVEYGESLGLSVADMKACVMSVTGQGQTSAIRVSQIARVRLEFRTRAAALEGGQS